MDAAAAAPPAAPRQPHSAMMFAPNATGALNVDEWLRLGPTSAVLEAVSHELSRARRRLQVDLLLHQEREDLEKRALVLERYVELINVHHAVRAGNVASVVNAYVPRLAVDRPFQLMGPAPNTRCELVLRDLTRGDSIDLVNKLHVNPDDGRCVFAAMLADRPVVVKRVPKAVLQRHRPEGRAQAMASLRREFVVQELLRPFAHPHLLLHERYYENQQDVFAVMERADESLFDLAVRGVTDVRVLADLFKQMTSAVVFLCGLGLVHRDLKLENFVVSRRGGDRWHLQLIDFGWTTSLRMADTFEGTWHYEEGRVGTASFMAPEVFIAAAPYDAVAAEVWGLGVCFFAIGCVCQPYEKPNLLDSGFQRIFQSGARAAILRNHRQNPAVIADSETLLNLVDAMLLSNPSNRPSLDTVLQTLTLACAAEHPDDIDVPASLAARTNDRRAAMQQQNQYRA